MPHVRTSPSSRKFKRWAECIGGTRLGRILRISPAHVSLLKNGKRGPSRTLARDIEREGAIFGYEILATGWR